MISVAPEWQDEAACAEAPKALFFHPSPFAISAAKAICRACPVRTPCLEHALEHQEPGVWGATTARDRALLRRKR